MKKLVEVAGQPLEWVQPSALAMNYELRTGHEPVATLRFRSMFGTFATAQSGDGCWTFKRVGFWQARVTIRECSHETELASFKSNLWIGGGGLVLADGRRYPATTNLWQTRLEFQNEAGAPLVTLRSRGLVHLGATVELPVRAAEIPEARWMMLLGWYLVVMMHMDAAGASGGAAAAS